ncbi:MAG: oxygen-independent coproporphyrinogen III oxidase [Acidiferrobacteraceae bacterium]|nr:oxygen-independent coproporphyrinogen III oxidase [Acidiferrobacteraceae bacterium]
MQPRPEFNPDLIRRYDRAGPRYTSYPTAVQFSSTLTAHQVRQLAHHSNEEPVPRPLSLYIHIPFCATLCFYCACNKIVTRNTQKAVTYLDYLYREVAMYGRLFDDDRRVVQLHLGGGTPTFLQPDQLENLITHIGSYFRLTDDIQRDYSIEIDPRTVSHQTLDRLQQIGFNRVSMGIQDFDSKVQAAVHRIQSPKETLDLLRYTRSQGFRSTNVDLIYGLPFQSVTSFSRTLDQLLEVMPDRLSIFNYAHLPHRFAPQQRIQEADLPDSEEKLQILGACIEQLTKAGYIHIGMDHFARPDDPMVTAAQEGSLHRNFQGYSTHARCELIGVGVSAISQIGKSYSQNSKDLFSYQEMIEDNQLPITRGVELSRDDEVRRDVIEKLMCQGEVNLPDALARHHIAYADYFQAELRRLEPLAQDKLVTVSGRGLIRVSPAGRYLLRNICMIFDHYLESHTEVSRHSRVI